MHSSFLCKKIKMKRFTSPLLPRKKELLLPVLPTLTLKMRLSRPINNDSASAINCVTFLITTTVVVIIFITIINKSFLKKQLGPASTHPLCTGTFAAHFSFLRHLQLSHTQSPSLVLVCVCKSSTCVVVCICDFPTYICSTSIV